MTLTTLIATAAGLLGGIGFGELLTSSRKRSRRRGMTLRALARLGTAINVRAANGLAARVAAAGLDRPVNEIVAVQLESGETEVLRGGADFFSNPRPSPDGSRLAWLEWHHPQMPWDGTELWVAPTAADGGLTGAPAQRPESKRATSSRRLILSVPVRGRSSTRTHRRGTL